MKPGAKSRTGGRTLTRSIGAVACIMVVIVFMLRGEIPDAEVARPPSVHVGRPKPHRHVPNAEQVEPNAPRHVEPTDAVQNAEQPESAPNGEESRAQAPRGRPVIAPFIIQADAHETVTKSMLTAMATVMRYAPEGMQHRYFSESKAREFIRVNHGLDKARVFDSVAAVPVKMALFVLCYLAKEGGVAIASTTVGTGPIDQIVDIYKDRLVYAVGSDKEVDPTIIAAASRQPAIVRAVEITFEGLAQRNSDFARKPFYGLSLAIQQVAVADARVHRKTADAVLPFDHVGSLIGGYRALDRDMARYHGPRALSEVVAGKTPEYFRDFVVGARQKPCPFNMTHGEMKGAVGVHPIGYVDMPPLTERRATSDVRSPIPRVIFQTSKSTRVPLYLRQAMQSTMDLNPTMEHRFFTDALQDEYVRERATPEEVKAYETLIPHAFRSDLFRYIYLLHEGGCYFDSDFVAAQTFEHLLNEETEFISAEDNGVSFLYNAIMCVSPGHSLMRMALNMSVHRILTHFYDVTTSALSITGPGLFAEAFDHVYGRPPREFQSVTRGMRMLAFRRGIECGAGFIVDETGKAYFATAYPEFRVEMKHYHKQRPYWEYVEARAAYADGGKILPEDPPSPDADLF